VGLGGIKGVFSEKILMMVFSGKVNTAFFTKKWGLFEPICIIYEIFAKNGIFRLIFQKVWHTIRWQANCEVSAAFLTQIERRRSLAECGAGGT
jgi:hypothetical protein